MKCINKWICLSLLIAVSCVSGCGKTSAAIEQPYDVYATAADFGLSSNGTAEAKSYFASDLCVSEDVAIGTDSTDSQVAEGAGTFNLETNTVVYAKNLYERLYPASTTKILTAYIALKYCDDLDAMVTVSENAVNQEAAAMGATRSHFVNPNGLPDENHYTCVYDMYLIFSNAIKNDTFVSIIGTTSYDVTYTDASGEAVTHTWENTNQYLTGNATTPDGFQIVGGKTGTTGEAGYCLVLYSYNPSGQPIISIVFKADGKSNLYLLMNEMLQGFAI